MDGAPSCGRFSSATVSGVDAAVASGIRRSAAAIVLGTSRKIDAPRAIPATNVKTIPTRLNDDSLMFLPCLSQINGCAARVRAGRLVCVAPKPFDGRLASRPFQPFFEENPLDGVSCGIIQLPLDDRQNTDKCKPILIVNRSQHGAASRLK